MPPFVRFPCLHVHVHQMCKNELFSQRCRKVQKRKSESARAIFWNFSNLPFLPQDWCLCTRLWLCHRHGFSSQICCSWSCHCFQSFLLVRRSAIMSRPIPYFPSLFSVRVPTSLSCALLPEQRSPYFFRIFFPNLSFFFLVHGPSCSFPHCPVTSISLLTKLKTLAAIFSAKSIACWTLIFPTIFRCANWEWKFTAFLPSFNTTYRIIDASTETSWCFWMILSRWKRSWRPSSSCPQSSQAGSTAAWRNLNELNRK